MELLSEPTFFAGRRLGVYFKGGRLMKDKKTDQRFWRFKWALTLFDADARACGGAIESTYHHIQARENAAEVIELSGATGGMEVQVFATTAEDSPPVLMVTGCFLDRFKMTFADGMTEFWIQLEHPLTDQLHRFVKDYAFQRFWVEFIPAQRSLTDAPADSGAGRKLAEFKPRGGRPN